MKRKTVVKKKTMKSAKKVAKKAAKKSKKVTKAKSTRRVVKAKKEESIERNSRQHRASALEAARQAEEVLPFFEQELPGDNRPWRAIAAIRAWAEGKLELNLVQVRELSLGAHAAARDVTTEAAICAAHAAGQAIAVWHVPAHAKGVQTYAAKAALADSHHRVSSKSPRNA